MSAPSAIRRRTTRARLAAHSGLHVRWIEHLVERYGSETEARLALTSNNPEHRQPLTGAEDYLARKSSTPPPAKEPCTWTTC
jgi:hypothetical protein